MAVSKETLMLMVSLMAALAPAAHSDTGTATYYTQNPVPPSCYQISPQGFYAAASPAIWGSNGACGRRYRITCTGATNPSTTNPCTGASVEVQINDFCPGCQATFDLSQNAFAIIADLNATTVLIEYSQI